MRRRLTPTLLACALPLLAASVHAHPATAAAPTSVASSILLAGAPAASDAVVDTLTAPRVRETAREVLGSANFQRDLPGPSAPLSFNLPDLGVLGRVLKLLAWTGFAVLVVLALLGAHRRFVEWRQLRADERPIEMPAAPLEIPIPSAEALAAQGRFGEAIHALLLETLQGLSRAARLPRSYTSREILARIPLGPEARASLADLVLAVELSWFGGAAPSATEYGSCLERFHVFLASYRRAA